MKNETDLITFIKSKKENEVCGKKTFIIVVLNQNLIKFGLLFSRISFKIRGNCLILFKKKRSFSE